VQSLSFLEGIFIRYGIDYSLPGFYDDPAFTAQEREDPNFLANYANYVELRPYSPDYLRHTRMIVGRLADYLYAQLKRDGRQNACVGVQAHLLAC